MGSYRQPKDSGSALFIENYKFILDETGINQVGQEIFHIDMQRTAKHFYCSLGYEEANNKVDERIFDHKSKKLRWEKRWKIKNIFTTMQNNRRKALFFRHY